MYIHASGPTEAIAELLRAWRSGNAGALGALPPHFCARCTGWPAERSPAKASTSHYYFGCLTGDRIAEALDISPAALYRGLRMAKSVDQKKLRYGKDQ